MEQAEYRRGHFELKYDPHLRSICTCCRGEISSLQVREVHEQALDWMRIHQTGKLLTDLSEMDVFDYEDQNWFLRQWIPKAAQAGYVASAIIIPTGIISYLNAVQLVQQIPKLSITLKVFRELKEGRQWISSFHTGPSAVPHAASDR